MEMREYLEILSSQIRSKKARPIVEEEIKGHIIDQSKAYQKEGMGEEKAMAEAIRQMGDPVEAGVALDRIHRPKMQWSLAAIFLVLTLSGLTMQLILILNGSINNDINITSLTTDMVAKTIFHTIISILIAFGVCVLDYSILSKNPLGFWKAYIAAGILLIVLVQRNAGYFYTTRITYYFMTIALIFYCGVLYAHRQKGMKGFLSILLNYFVIVMLTLFLGNSFTSIIEFSCGAILLISVAILKGWYGKSKIKMLSAIWSAAIGLPSIIFAAIYYNQNSEMIIASYQMARLNIFVTGDFYQREMLKQVMNGVSLFGNKDLPITILPSIQSDYIVTCIFSYFGILAACGVIFIFILFLYKSFKTSYYQKNQLGSIISYGCTVAILVKGSIYICSNIFLGVITQVSMPFLSYGLGNAVLSGILAGLLLSVYRGTNIIKEKESSLQYRIKLSIKKETL